MSIRDSTSSHKSRIQTVFNLLKDYCEAQKFKGWDPYDALNSKLLNALLLDKSRMLRLLWIQAFKRSPINLRKLFFVKKQVNPQALGLFASGYVNAYRINRKAEDRDIVQELCGQIVKLKSPGYSGSCWGYNFDWQARAFFQPKFSPTVVATSFVSNGLLDAHEIIGDKSYVDEARSACEFVLNDLNRFYNDDGSYGFSYSPIDFTPVYNATFLGARLLSRVFSITGENYLKEAALSCLQYCLKGQETDGSWPYGQKSYHNWKDSFHTGYNLECLGDIIRYCKVHEYEYNLRKGIEYYFDNFFEENGWPKYYHNNRYPADINSVAQLIITLQKLGLIEKHRDQVNKVIEWATNNLYNGQYFYYQKKKFATIKIPYMRWNQAWMFYALSCYLTEINEKA
jgi:hypothetical protein